MCGECQDWLHEIIEKSKHATREAFKVFLNTVEAIIPEATSMEFEDFWDSYEILQESVGLHVAECLPQPESVVMPLKRKPVKKFHPASKQSQPDAMWLPFGWQYNDRANVGRNRLHAS